MFRLKFLCVPSILILLAGGAAPAARPAEPVARPPAATDFATDTTENGPAGSEPAGKRYTAKALLEVQHSTPHILTRTAEKFDPAEFESYRATQMQLIKSPWVQMAALRDPRIRNRASVRREDDRHNAIKWLGEQIRVECPDRRAGIITVSLTGSDRVEAAALVNAVVGAYMEEIVNGKRQARRIRLSDLQQVYAEKEVELRSKQDQLKRERDNIGLGDRENTAARTQLAMNVYLDLHRQFQAMRAEHRSRLAKLAEAKSAVWGIASAEIPQLEVVAVLNNDPVYQDLRRRLMTLEEKVRADEAVHATTPSAEAVRTRKECEATKDFLGRLESDVRNQVRDDKRIAWENERRRLETEIATSNQQMTLFEKEVEGKRQEAEAAGRETTTIQMEQAEVDNLQRVLREVEEERETLQIELRAPPRVRVIGDPVSPAMVPESAD